MWARKSYTTSLHGQRYQIDAKALHAWGVTAQCMQFHECPLVTAKDGLKLTVQHAAQVSITDMLEETGLHRQDITNLLALRNQVAMMLRFHTPVCVSHVFLAEEAHAHGALWYH